MEYTGQEDMHLQMGRAPVRTEKGIERFLWSLYIMLFFGVFGVISGLLALSFSGSAYNYTAMENNTTMVMEHMGGVAVALMALGCFTTILMILYIVLLLLGVFSFHSGKNELGPAHFKAVSKGLLSFILMIISMVIGILIYMVMAFSIAARAMQGDIGGSIGNLSIYILAGVLFMSLLGQTFLGLTYSMMIKEIVPEDKRKFLWIGLLLFIIGGLISVAVTYIGMPHGLENMSPEQMSALNTNLRGISNIGSISGIVGVIMYIMAYKPTLELIKRNKFAINPPTGAGGYTGSDYGSSGKPPEY